MADVAIKPALTPERRAFAIERDSVTAYSIPRSY